MDSAVDLPPDWHSLDLRELIGEMRPPPRPAGTAAADGLSSDDGATSEEVSTIM